MRILTVAILVGTSAFAVNSFSSSKAENSQLVVEAEESTVDPIVTGQTISSEERKNWEERRKKFLDCADCDSGQPYPGE